MVAAMEFFLVASSEATGFRGERRLQEVELSRTPPALTVFQAGAVPWKENPAFIVVEAVVGLPEDFRGRVLYQEWFDESEGDCDRRLWLVGA